jgi:hypothetical protein
MQKDCRAAMAHINEAVELLQREVDNLVRQLSAALDAEEGDFALKRLEEVRAQLEATRLRSRAHSD